MPLDIKSLDQFVTDEIAAINAALPGTFQFPVGSYTMATVQAHARLAIWQESNIEFVFSSIRLSTSIGDAVDTFLADFGLERLPAFPATGEVTFASFTNTTLRTINIGATVSQTNNNALSYAVIVDLNNPNYHVDLNVYQLQIGTSSISVPVAAITAGLSGNCEENSINIINSPINGIDTVNNPVAFTNGQDIQSDAQARAYFVTYINSLSRATQSAIEFSVESVKGVEEFTVQENKLYPSLAVDLGRIFAVIDDGTGDPPDALVTEVLASVGLYRGLAIRYDVYKPIPINVTITATITTPAGYDATNLKHHIESELTGYVRSVPFGGTLFYTQVAYQIYRSIVDSDTSFSVNPSLIDAFNVSSIIVNGGVVDVTSTAIEKFIVVDGDIEMTIN